MNMASIRLCQLMLYQTRIDLLKHGTSWRGSSQAISLLQVWPISDFRPCAISSIELIGHNLINVVKDFCISLANRNL